MPTNDTKPLWLSEEKGSVNPTHNYQCTICGYRKGIIVQLPFDHRICLGCMGLAIGKRHVIEPSSHLSSSSRWLVSRPP